MAGGIGSRFWPVSRTSVPKQFLDILGVGHSLLQLTYNRFVKIMPKENIFIVTNRSYIDLVSQQLPELPTENILLEPYRRNTAPCIAFANFKILKKNPNANIVVAPSDHLIVKEDEFLKVVNSGLDFVSKNEALLTLGITPSRPETGYGYIQSNNEVKVEGYNNLMKVKTFTEKPNLEMARVFLESGEFFWNSGIFLWSVKSINKAFDEFLPEINTLFAEGKGLYYTPMEDSFINDIYPRCKSISIDYGIMEKAKNVYVLCSDIGWSDLGTWGSLYEHSKKDDAGNHIDGDSVFAYDIKNTVVKVPSNKVVVVQGLTDYIVAESDGILLICKMQDEQMIKQFVNDVKLKKGEEFA
jgi:mannose-1-phosphate guanylyltransferase